MQVGNVHYRTENDIPSSVPLFPLSGALLLPCGQMPLNIFEPRYLAMIDDVIGADRIIAIIQPQFDLGEETRSGDCPTLCSVGTLGRITSLSETGDGRYIISLVGICRFRLLDEAPSRKAYRQGRIAPFLNDLSSDNGDDKVDRNALLESFRAYLEANQLEADWESVGQASNATLVNTMSMMAPYGPAEKQALLEAPDLRTRAETLVAITEIALARDSDDYDTVLQ
ncbi:LON peptidase substrate-binding domain-containing protein [Hoeflea prorocentri]|uniref:LON peptidase substrate-binding domain-containing protein n=1 Tax=Hoeflea prorocentri TaxID=1922333 RepID=A0A9X3ZJS3_9HYPH|nr:LON peptidase substrate-binding domain-containing protein [Hoeflea prorocentri]MCY6383281.1 LON peptidase substrate-binding domain-containing protein [Hoeflea prorocentri]MDA5401081.1 LON peptidase substrate-binding domain-containing protein [Hoeflea prorocentri]